MGPAPIRLGVMDVRGREGRPGYKDKQLACLKAAPDMEVAKHGGGFSPARSIRSQPNGGTDPHSR